MPAIVPLVEKALDSPDGAVNETSPEIQLPLWFEPERGTPNSFLRSALFAAIQSKDRKFLKEVTLASSRDVSLKFTGEQLNQEDLDVWATLVHLARVSPLGHTCHFTAHGLLTTLGLHTGGHEHRRLHSTITRLRSATIEVRHGLEFYVGGLIEDLSGRDEAESPDQPAKRYAVRLNKKLIVLFGETQWTALDWEQRRKLRRKPLAEALHGYFSSHRRPLPVKLATLQAYTGSRNQQPADFKRKVAAALDELKKIQFLGDYHFEDDRVIVHRV
jgi:hypothetical protein